MIKFSFLYLVLFFSINAYSQEYSIPTNPEICGEHEHRNNLINSNPEFKSQDSIDEVEFQNFYENFLSDWSPNDRSTYIIPVVVHVVHTGGIENISNEQIFNALETLNNDFSMQNADVNSTITAFQNVIGNADIEFRLATKDPFGNCHSGITRTHSSTTNDVGMSGGGHAIVDAVAAQHGVWPQGDYMSIFVCKDPSGNAGYTYRPSNFFSPNEMYGAIFMRHDYTGVIGTSSSQAEHTLSHEAGHWLNLSHVWGNNNSAGDATSCGIDDGVSDTPLTIGWQSCNLNGTTCGSLDNVQNIMDYSYCSTMFTVLQGARMQAALNSGTAGRSNLSSISNLQTTGVNGVSDEICDAVFISNTTIICPGEQIEFSDISVHNITGRNWTFVGGSPVTSTDSTVSVTYDTPGEYTVILNVFNVVNNETTTYTNVIKVLGSQSLPFTEGFENLSLFPDNIRFSVDNPNLDYTWSLSNSVSSSGSSSLILKNYYVNNQDFDKLISGNIDLSVLDPDDDVTLSFKYAYNKKESNNDEWLRIYVSKDCGETWVAKKLIHGNLLSNQVTASYYSPDDDEWQLVEITNISNTYYVENFRFKIEFISDNGNNIYLDDINITSPNFSDLNDIEETFETVLYPNPTENISELKITSSIGKDVDIKIYNVAGQVIKNVFTGKLESSNTSFNVDAGNLEKGIYYVSIKSDNQSKTLKLIKI